MGCKPGKLIIMLFAAASFATAQHEHHQSGSAKPAELLEGWEPHLIPLPRIGDGAEVLRSGTRADLWL